MLLHRGYFFWLMLVFVRFYYVHDTSSNGFWFWCQVLVAKLGGAGATLATVLWSGTSSYRAMSSVAAPPRHPAPSISNIKVMYWSTVLVRESGFAIRVRRTCTSSREVLFNVRALLPWCVRVKWSGANKEWSFPIGAWEKKNWMYSGAWRDYKKGLKRDSNGPLFLVLEI